MDMLEKRVFSSESSVGDLELELKEIRKFYESEKDDPDLNSVAGLTFAQGGFYTILCC